MPSMWKFFRDIRLTGVSVDITVGMRKGGVTLVELDRAIARGYSDDKLFRERYDVCLFRLYAYIALLNVFTPPPLPRLTKNNT